MVSSPTLLTGVSPEVRGRTVGPGPVRVHDSYSYESNKVGINHGGIKPEETLFPNKIRLSVQKKTSLKKTFFLRFDLLK